MKKEILIRIVIIILTGSSILLYLKHKKSVSERDKVIEIITEKYNTISSKAEEYFSMVINNLYSESTFIYDTLVLSEQETLEKIRLCELVNNGPVLALRFSQYSCNVCVERELQSLSEMDEPIAPDRFVILASFENIRHANIFKRDNQISYPIYLIDELGLPLPIESLSVPYFFLIEENCRTSNFFYPLLSTPELSVQYFKIIKEKCPFLFY